MINARINELFNDDMITEIMVNGTDSVYFERQGRLHRADFAFTSEPELYLAIKELLTPSGKQVSVERPFADGWLNDGSRVHVIIPPLSRRGPAITIRRFPRKRFSGEDLVASDMCSRSMLRFLEACIRGKRNIIISGGTGSGKTTLLNALSGYINDTERIITIEDTAELCLNQKHVVSLETRQSGPDTGENISIRQLLINTLRMRPDRIIVGECRGGETLDMLQAMNCGHQGSLSTLHANSARECLKRMEIMALMSGMDLPVRALREIIAYSINIIVHTGRTPQGERKILEIGEVTGMEGDTITMSPLFKYEKGIPFSMENKGNFVATGILPACREALEEHGITLEPQMFQ